MLDLEAFRRTPLKREPYPYLVVSNFIAADQLDRVLADFPVIQHPGSIPVSAAPGGPGFQALLAELEGDVFRRAISEKFALPLDGYPVMTTVRGVIREKDGGIHTDSKTKVVTVLLYLNRDWHDDGGQLRVLRDDHDLDNYAAEIPPTAGTLMVFQVTDNCWHGHKPAVGKRLSVQMNYVIGEAAKGKHQFLHRLSARTKALFGRFAPAY
ncbi:MAG: 2OG-Fe(II) oxygenase [Porticoccaceae bacterium]